MIKVLVVEDSIVIQALLLHILGSDPELTVIGVATNGKEAIEAVERYRPDVITMDIHMPQMDGLTATRRIMETYPTPIIIVSGSQTSFADKAMRAMEAGALTILNKPAGLGSREYTLSAKELVQTVKLMSEIKMVKRWHRPKAAATPTTAAGPTPSDVKLLAIGASTGGPVAIQKILAGLGRNFAVPVLVVQHMAAGFIDGFVNWLNETTEFPVRVAAHGDRPLAGHGYVAPSGFQMEVEIGPRIALHRRVATDSSPCPSVARLFGSVADILGRHSIGVLLTGMGKDGATELKRLKDKGAVTIAQDRQSSVIFGMPGEAVALDAATYVLGLDAIAPMLLSLTAKKEDTA